MTDWPEYNKKLVNETVDVFFSKSLLIDQEKQLKKMNKGKRGKPYMYSDAPILIILAVRDTLDSHTDRLKVLPGC